MGILAVAQNLLPFEPREALRFGRFSPMRFKMRLLRLSQGRSFARADGVIFLTRYAQAVVQRQVRGGVRASAQELARTSSIDVTPASTFSMPSWRNVRMPSTSAWRSSSSARWPVWIIRRSPRVTDISSWMPARPR